MILSTFWGDFLWVYFLLFFFVLESRTHITRTLINGIVTIRKMSSDCYTGLPTERSVHHLFNSFLE